MKNENEWTPTPTDKDLFVCAHPEWQEKRESSTFWQDFSIADAFGPAAVRDTYRRAFRAWKDDYKMLTELVAVLNHKIWQHYGRGRDKRARLYDSLWRQADEYGSTHLKGEELDFFVMVLD